MAFQVILVLLGSSCGVVQEYSRMEVYTDGENDDAFRMQSIRICMNNHLASLFFKTLVPRLSKGPTGRSDAVVNRVFLSISWLFQMFPMLRLRANRQIIPDFEGIESDRVRTTFMIACNRQYRHLCSFGSLNFF